MGRVGIHSFTALQGILVLGAAVDRKPSHCWVPTLSKERGIMEDPLSQRCKFLPVPSLESWSSGCKSKFLGCQWSVGVG